MKAGKKANILILSIYHELAEEFLSSFTIEPKTEVAINDFLVTFEIVAGDPSQDPTFAESLAKADAMQLTAAARRNGMRNLREDGWMKVPQGLTTAQEVLRVTQEL